MLTTIDLLRWLDARRDEVNELIIAARPDEQSAYHNDLKIINALSVIVRRLGDAGAKGV